MFRQNGCIYSEEYPCVSSSSELSCAECNDGTREDLSNFWSKLVNTPCSKNGGVRAYKCKKCQ